MDETERVQRHTCKHSGVRMFGPVTRDHAFKGLNLGDEKLFRPDASPDHGKHADRRHPASDF